MSYVLCDSKQAGTCLVQYSGQAEFLLWKNAWQAGLFHMPAICYAVTVYRLQSISGSGVSYFCLHYDKLAKRNMNGT